MESKLSGLTKLRERLERLRPEEVMARALAEQAERMAARVREGLSGPPGAGGHDQPWVRSGALRDSVGAQADGLQAVVGSSDPAAAPQELGTVHVPARPFLAPVAAEMGEEVARAVGAAMAGAIMGDNGVDPRGEAVILTGASAGDSARGAPYSPLGIFQPGSPESMDWARRTLQDLRKLGHILHSEQDEPPAELAKPGEATLSEDRLNHIVDQHGHNQGIPGKSEFPPDWTKGKIGEVVLDVANDPASSRSHAKGGRTKVNGTREGVDVEVIIGRDGKAVVTAYPTNTEQSGESS